MTESMVERVARAIEASLGGRTNSSDVNPIIDPLHPDLRAALPGMARAAVAAMREPTEAMKEAGATYCQEYADSLDAYHAMIDAALKEP